MTQFSPELWRVLNYLHQHKHRTARSKLALVRQSQDITDADLLDLDEMYLIVAEVAHREVPLSAVVKKLSKYARLRLTRPGLTIVNGDAFNQMRCTLGQHSQPVTLRKLFDGSTLTHDEVKAAARDRQITITLAEDLPHDFGWLTHLHELPASQVRVALTSKGREYLPR